MKIKSKSLWNKSIQRYQDVYQKYPSTPEDIAVVTAIYRKLGGKITVSKSSKVYEAFNLGPGLKENLKNDVKGFLTKYIKNPIVLGIALYFLLSYLGKFIKKN